LSKALRILAQVSVISWDAELRVAGFVLLLSYARQKKQELQIAGNPTAGR
jgi:hypothetical protein